MPEKKTEHFTKTELKEKTDYFFNEGRINADRKWIDEINERIAELERQVSIPELKRIRDKTRYRWEEDEKRRKDGSWRAKVRVK